MKDYKPPLKLCEIQVSYKPKKAHRPQITSSEDAFRVLLHCYDGATISYREEFIVLFLNRANRVLGYRRISEGGVAGTVVDAKIILSIALKVAASSLVLSHNHPSHNVNPSQADIDLTRKIKDACELLDMLLLDHIIVAPEGGFYSFADESLI